MIIILTENKFRKLFSESFRGERGLSNLGSESPEMLALQNAKAMMKKNESPLKIKQTTGWEIGYDGNWKYEGVDGTVKQVPSASIRVLSDLWDDDDLYRWYPSIRNTKVLIEYGDSGNFAGALGGVIQIPPSLLWWENKTDLPLEFLKRECDSTIQHEIQHLIQGYEGWESGAPSPSLLTYNETIGQLKASIDLAEKVRGLDWKEIYNISKSYDKNSIERNSLVDIALWVQNGDTIDDYIKDAQNRLDNYPTFEEFEDDVYYSNKGEMEAYEVNDRYGMTYDQRRNSLMKKR
jgi:hypothetical protein